MDDLLGAERSGFAHGRAVFPKDPPSHLSEKEAAAWIRGWEFAKEKALHGLTKEQIHQLVDISFVAGNADVFYALDNFVEVAIVNKLRG